MQVFKLCGKVMWKNRFVLILYLAMFLMMALITAAAFYNSGQATGYAAEKTDIAFFAEEDTPLVEGLRAALAENVNFVDVKDTDAARADALYFRDVSYILRVPKGFTAAFLAGEDPKLEKTSVSGSIAGAYVEAKLSRWLQTADLYVKTGAVTDQAQLVQRIAADMQNTAAVTLTQKDKTSADQQPYLAYYFNFLSYILTAVLISVIAVILQVFNNRDLRRRTFCSPMTQRSYNAQFLLAITAFSIGVWAVMVLGGAIFDRGEFFTPATAFLALNAFVFMLTVTALAFLIGNLTSSREAVGAMANVCALGPSFLGGVFVPQRFLSAGVLAASRFTPTYWYVKATNLVTSANDLKSADLSPYYGALGIVACFGAAFLALGLVVGKRRRTAE